MPSSQRRGFSPFMKPMCRRANPDEETTDWRAVCGKTASTVRRAGRASALSDPYAGCPMRSTAHQTRENRTITVDVQNEATYFQLLSDRKAFVDFVRAFLLSLGFQLQHQATCRGGGCVTRHSQYVRVRLGSLTIWRIQGTTGRAVFTVVPPFVLRYRQMGSCPLLVI